MECGESGPLVREIMEAYAAQTGLFPEGEAPRRYLWTDAFAVCNYLELFRRTGEDKYRDLALRLVDQVHEVLGRHRPDDPRKGWISGLDEKEGSRHPTAGGLRIGKGLSERPPDEPLDERLEWDRDGQYYHYLTKWMHALHRAGRVAGDPDCSRWAVELARAVHPRFTYAPAGALKRMYWKMSIDLTRPLVPSMGQHDPLDGLVTYSEIQVPVPEGTEGGELRDEIAELTGICRGLIWNTDDPLGIGGLLDGACRIAQLTAVGAFGEPGLLEAVLDPALRGLESFARSGALGLPAAYRLAFRELGLSIGLRGAERLKGVIEGEPGAFDRDLTRRVEDLLRYAPLGEKIERFWLKETNRAPASWKEHRDINMVMLAASLAPDGFLSI